jgi:hypothetical protein
MPKIDSFERRLLFQDKPKPTSFDSTISRLNNTWPPPTDFVTPAPEPIQFDSQYDSCSTRLFLLMVYALLDEYIPMDEAIKDRLGIDFKLFAENPIKIWNKVAGKLFKICMELDKNPDRAKDDTVYEFFTNVLKTYTLFHVNNSHWRMILSRGTVKVGDQVVEAGIEALHNPRTPRTYSN